MSVEPQAIANLVESFVSNEYEDDRKYENRTPLDESGVWTLHRLAAAIYALGFEDGSRTGETRARGQRQRKSATIASQVAS